ncbi:glycerophosphodiester phosphodiesterase [Altericista sp. CCNU0014]|uniref:glycerophosphodiester phosphodiesterase n=1 Tax=Altericista sp. CCNU0014 TaxID=3082949 RepID=UPI00384FBCBA
MLTLSHRGVQTRAPENTLAAFEAAIALGVGGIETDIRLSRDGIPILFHDRLTPDGDEVASVTQAELSDRVGYAISTLEEALQLALLDSKEFLWNLEIKTPDALEPTIEILRRYITSRRVLITSFWHPLVVEIGRRIEVDCGLLVAHRPLNFQSRPDWIPNHPSINTLVYYYGTLDSEVVAQSQACGFRTFAYGAETHRDHERLAQWQVDGVISDRPEFLLK